MQRIIDSNELEYFIKKFDIDNIFEKDMRNHMELHQFAKGEQIYNAGTKADYVYFIVKGKFKVLTVQKNGKSILIRFYEPFLMLGDIELLGYVDPLCSLEALSEVICIGVSFEIIRNQCMEDTKFLSFVAKSLAQKLIESSTSSSINLSFPLENRLASYLLAISPEENIVGIATNKLTEMAGFLGTSYRHLSRTLNKLYSKNLIRKENNYIEILNREELEKLAGDLYK